MRKTISRFTSSFAALLTDGNTNIDVDGRLEQIREALLDILTELDGDHCKDTWSKVGRATEAQSLWYLRSEMMQLIAASYGEEIARRKLDAITEMFRGVVPENQMPVKRRF